MEKLNVLATDGTIIDQEYRDVIHQQGLLHGEVHVWCVTPDDQLIFQHRGKDKDTYPDLLDATAGGHVDLGESYEEAAIKELCEETGLTATPEELVFLTTEIHRSYDEATNMTNHPRRNVYFFKRRVHPEELAVEAGKAQGFVSYSFVSLFALDEVEKSKFIPTLLDANGLRVFRLIKESL